MNRVILMGRLTRDPEIRYSQNNNQMAIAKFTIAVDRRGGRNNNNQDGQTADFISCTAFGRTAEFAEKYLHKGTKIACEGRIQTGSFTNKDGQKVYTTDVILDNVEFAESKNAQGAAGGFNPAPAAGFGGAPAPQPAGDEFMNIPDGIDEELPFG